MTELAQNYHDTLQSNNLNQDISREELEQRLQMILEEIPANQHLQGPERTQMSQKITEQQVRNALKMTQDGSVTGLDGCPYELWKALQKQHDNATHRNRLSFNVVKMLTYLYQDIQEHGIDERTQFTMGWMCLILKKKDPTDISNYQPITLLNTDYKILTKVLALQLMEPIHHLVVKAIAGLGRLALSDRVWADPQRCLSVQ
jgi:hypothetical protein